MSHPTGSVGRIIARDMHRDRGTAAPVFPPIVPKGTRQAPAPARAPQRGCAPARRDGAENTMDQAVAIRSTPLVPANVPRFAQVLQANAGHLFNDPAGNVVMRRDGRCAFKGRNGHIFEVRTPDMSTVGMGLTNDPNVCTVLHNGVAHPFPTGNPILDGAAMDVLRECAFVSFWPVNFSAPSIAPAAP